MVYLLSTREREEAAKKNTSHSRQWGNGEVSWGYLLNGGSFVISTHAGCSAKWFTGWLMRLCFYILWFYIELSKPTELLKTHSEYPNWATERRKVTWFTCSLVITIHFRGHIQPRKNLACFSAYGLTRKRAYSLSRMNTIVSTLSAPVLW